MGIRGAGRHDSSVAAAVSSAETGGVGLYKTPDLLLTAPRSTGRKRHRIDWDAVLPPSVVP